MLVNASAASFCVAPMATFMPVYAKDIFHGGPHTLGLLMGASGLGAVFAALYLACRTTVLGMGAGGIAHVASVHVVFIASGMAAVAIGLAFRRELPQLRAVAHPVLAERGFLPGAGKG